MYTKPIFYKVYSIIIMVFSIIGFISSLIQSFAMNNNFFSSIPYLKDIIMTVSAFSVVLSLLSLFFVYVEFSSMYTFGEMIEHEQSNSVYPFEKKGFVLSPKFYRGYGTAIFFIIFVLQMIACIVMIISASIETKSLITIPLIPVIGSVVSTLFMYITYYVKFKAFGDLLEIVSSKDVTEQMKCNLKENKSGILRGYCGFLFVVAIIFLIFMIVCGVLLFDVLCLMPFGIGFVSLIIFVMTAASCFISLSITGCYFDNLGKMVEHHMIKHNLYEEK